MPSFELFVAQRYLRAKRKQAVISIITVISILGVAAGVMALIIALAVTTGFKNTLQRSLLGATAHITLLSKNPAEGIENWRELATRLSKLPHVLNANPTLFGEVLFAGPLRGQGGVLKGLDMQSTTAFADLSKYMKQGSMDGLAKVGERFPCILLGSVMAEKTGMLLNSVITVISPQGEITPLGPRPSSYQFRVCGIYKSDFFELDSLWAFASLEQTQRVTSLPGVVSAIEFRVDDIYQAPEIAKQIEQAAAGNVAATHWQEQNRPILNALKMDRIVTLITIGLIELIAGLNILISLVMMVMEKNKDIAILVSMGARVSQIRKIFVMQGLIIGAVGTALGLIAGYTISYLAGHYHWIQLDEAVYSLSYVPFEPRWTDGVWVAAAAMVVSYLATIYPARAAARILPLESLRYE